MSDFEIIKILKKDEFEDYILLYALVKNRKTGQVEKRFIIEVI